MFKIGLTVLRFNLSKIQANLKLLNLSPPTSKKQIKSKYIQLAKQLHPDVKEANRPNLTPAEIQKKSEAFIEITKAYKFLCDLQESEINNHKEEGNGGYFQNSKTESTENQSQEYSRPLTPQERTRRATNAYFNRKYRKEGSQEHQQQKKEPLYRQIPEFFLGCLFVAAFLVEWAYTAIRRSSVNVVKAPKKEQDLDVFEGMSFKKRFDEKIQ